MTRWPTKRVALLQIGLWLVFYLMLFLYSIQKWNISPYAFFASTTATLCYIILAYGHSQVLIPRLLNKKRTWYFIASVFFLASMVFLRMCADKWLLFPIHGKFYDFSTSHFAFVFITNLLAFLFGGLLWLALDYFKLQKKQAELNSQQLSSQLQLLKAQVQPHFLFNTLNNIYYLAYTRQENTAAVVAKLSDIMRYFIDTAPREQVDIRTELEFIENYIELEQIRMRYPVQVHIHCKADTTHMVPPMLLIPFVENIYKHGVDKESNSNRAEITLTEKAGYLEYSARNTVYENEKPVTTGMGLTNLSQRLALLYGTNFILSARREENEYLAFLSIPLR